MASAENDRRLHSEIANYLRLCPALNQLCAQNGWIENRSIQFEVKRREPGQALVAVRFEEVAMKGAGCEARRLPRFGYLQLELDAQGKIRGAIVI